ncbi:hypothetical protein ACJIZ3_002018 [Penstemon smallii]|uniref:TPX2 C-terminal domain-containing protein n=1 Tax=Penstemon smallii TaxID=265156 RepID=A0ABD3U877_9LAMI
MESSSKTAGSVTTPVKEKTAHSNRSKLNETPKYSENSNPNVSSPGLKSSNSPSIVKSGKSSKKSASRNPKLNQTVVTSPLLKTKIRERKFVIAKKKSRNQELNSSTTDVACDKCKKPIGKSKCLCKAYESLRASHEEFFKNSSEVEDNEVEFDKLECGAEIEKGKMEGNDEKTDAVNEAEVNLKRSRDKLLEELRSGRVMHLVKAFENLSVLKLGDFEEKESVVEEEEDKRKIKTALQQPLKVSEIQASSSSFSPSEFFLTSESLGLDSRRSYSLDSSQGSFSISTRTSAGGQRSRRSSAESSGAFARRQWRRKQRKATSQKPFMLRTEQRGRCKEEEFMKKLQQMLEEEEKLRIPLAQALPLTTDEPECLVKPPVKEITRPIDLVLHSDTRAVERSEFDQQVAEKINLIRQYRMERERRQKLEEDEEIRRLRKELVPKAQPLPYFDRPFVPRRSMKQPTLPKEPKFHIPQHKKIKCNMSINDLYVQRQ